MSYSGCTAQKYPRLMSSGGGQSIWNACVDAYSNCRSPGMKYEHVVTPWPFETCTRAPVFGSVT
jgi:hypothetical protein